MGDLSIGTIFFEIRNSVFEKIKFFKKVKNIAYASQKNTFLKPKSHTFS